MENHITNPDILALHDLSWQSRAARVLYVANGLDIFTVLCNKAISVKQICRKCHTNPEMTEKLLIACTAMGLLNKQAGLYKNTEVAQTYLVRGQPLYQGDIIAHCASVGNFWDTLDEQIMAEKAPTKTETDEHRNFIMGMHNIAVAGRAKMFTDTIDLSGRKKLFDVGAGPGTYSIAACKQYPQLNAVVFDLPETIAITKEIIAKEAMADRISVRTGSWETDDFGQDNDVVLLSNVLHGHQSQAQQKLDKAYSSMVQGGLLVIQEFLLNDHKTGPLIPTLFNIMVGAYSQAELLTIVEDAGFAAARVVASFEDVASTWITADKP